MSLSFCSFSSGSSGNCYFIKTEKTSVIVDCGISGRRILNALSDVGCEPEDVSGVFITHEHIDHIKSTRILSKKLPNANFYASIGTWKHIEENIPSERQIIAGAGDASFIGDIRCVPFRLSHDACDPIGYTFTAGGRKISIVTDTGYVTEEIHGAIKDSDLLVLEANHDINMLEYSRYPYSVKRRIMGDFGHLSNDAAAGEIARIFGESGKYMDVLLAHLSRENNFPEMAYQTVRNSLEENGIIIGKHLDIHIIERDKISPVFTLDFD